MDAISAKGLQNEIQQLRQSVAGLILLNGRLWQKLKEQGSVAPNDPCFEASLQAGSVLDEDLRRIWDQAFGPDK